MALRNFARDRRTGEYGRLNKTFLEPQMPIAKEKRFAPPSSMKNSEAKCFSRQKTSEIRGMFMKYLG
ncbi:hypothetical protein ACH42_10470 [Endozoicomonas sp. (ex Bugula neritina AB1)]|nr:hypothetical protein ACH42_10470 [Endozoicomonas sp. (ex Bugula neritina AB1)]